MNNVICLKVGNRYSSDYVNKLYNSCLRHLRIDYNFYCFTENTKGLDPSILIKDLPVEEYPFIEKWWWKSYLHKEGLFPEEDINLFIDLDMVIVNSLEKFFEYEKDHPYISCCAPLLRNKVLANYLFRWQGNYDKVWDLICRNLSLMKDYRSDQEYIADLLFGEISFYPREWVQSYKWEIRNSSELVLSDKNLYVFETVRDDIEIPSETSVLAFHGTPFPHMVQDSIVFDNWK